MLTPVATDWPRVELIGQTSIHNQFACNLKEKVWCLDSVNRFSVLIYFVEYFYRRKVVTLIFSRRSLQITDLIKTINK